MSDAEVPWTRTKDGFPHLPGCPCRTDPAGRLRLGDRCPSGRCAGGEDLGWQPDGPVYFRRGYRCSRCGHWFGSRASV